MCRICDGCQKIEHCDDDDCIITRAFVCKNCEKTWGWCYRQQKYIDKSKLCIFPKILATIELYDYCLVHCILQRSDYSQEELHNFVTEKIHGLFDNQSFNLNDRRAMIQLLIFDLQQELSKEVK